MTEKKLPLWLKLAFTAWMLAWVPVYAWHHGLQNFLWLCDLCNFVMLAALWSESSLLFSSQLVAVFIPALLWTVDVGSAALFGVHPIGGTEYMFDPTLPLYLRLLSLFHIFDPLILIWTVRRLGFDRRGIVLQSALTCLVLPATYLLTDPERNINWVYGLFGRQQDVVHPWTYLLLCLICYPLVLYLPTHLLAALVFRRPAERE